jgi:branched-chain amino acid transport system permease protein
MFIIAGIGISVFLENLVQIVWGPAPLIVRPMIAATTLSVGGVFLEPQAVAIVIVTGCILFGEHYFLRHTMVGKMTQAVAQDKDAASLMGINVGRMIAITFLNSTILAGIGGVFIAPVFYVSVGIGSILLKAFSACVVGGFGNASGTILGGLIVGAVHLPAIPRCLVVRPAHPVPPLSTARHLQRAHRGESLTGRGSSCSTEWCTVVCWPFSSCCRP